MADRKVALVTGAAGGIGKGIAEKFLKEGLAVAIADIQDELGKETCQELSAYGECRFYHIDLLNMEEVKALVPKVAQEMGSVDVLVNNAGIPNRSPIDRVTEEEYDRMFGVHLKSGFFLAQAAVEYMKEKRWGRIVNVSSPRAVNPDVTHPLYGMCKAAVRSMTEYFAVGFSRWNIRTNAISPALIYTPMTEHYRNEPGHEASLRNFPSGAYQSVEDLANLVWFLVSDESLSVNGMTVEADMGLRFVNGLSLNQYTKYGHPLSYKEEK